jgi:ribosomal protein S6--L-glutamate ligase
MKLGIITGGGPGAKMIIEKAREYFDEVESINIKKLATRVSTNAVEVLYDGQPLKGFDCLYMRGSWRYEQLLYTVTHLLQEKVYMPLHHSVFPVCHNKLLTLLRLQKDEVAVPETYFCAKTDEARNVLEKVHYPIILKTPSGTQGKGVMFADSISSAKSLLDALEAFNQPYLIQEYIDTGATDIRAFVVGDKVVAAMKRKAASNELRANIHAGGTGMAFELDYDTEQLAIKAAKAIKAEICGVDILIGSKSVVLEVNSSPGLAGIMGATDIAVDDIIARYLFEKTVAWVKSRRQEGVDDIMKDLEPKKVIAKNILTNVEIKSGRIKLPEVVTRLAGLNNGDEVVIDIDRHSVAIKKNM